jgi:putative DNA primase/helicase
LRYQVSNEQDVASIAADWHSSMPSSGPENPHKNSTWRDRLLLSHYGTPKALLANAVLALSESPTWDGVLAFDEFAMRVVTVAPTPWRQQPQHWTDTDDILLADWLQHEGIHVGPSVAAQAVEAVAHFRKCHPIRDYLRSLNWDGVRRIETWLLKYVGCEDSTFVRAVGKLWLISAVARVQKPGCKADCCLILEGLQGGLKSTAISILGGPWFADEMSDLGSKDAALQLQGVWIFELGELDAMSRSDSGRIKSFMSRSVDHFRPPYGRRAVDFPRQCVFAGTVNPVEYLKDETGARRFWPVATGTIDIEALKRDRDQIWAEAYHDYLAGSRWWLEGEELSKEAHEQQSDRYVSDPWDSLIAGWLKIVQPIPNYPAEAEPRFTSCAESVTIADILVHCIGKRPDQWIQPDQNRVAKYLSSQRWIRRKKGPRNAREYRYFRPALTRLANADH